MQAKVTSENIVKRKRWTQKCEIDDRHLPVPTQIVSNEEFAPPDQTDEQRRVEHWIERDPQRRCDRQPEHDRHDLPAGEPGDVVVEGVQRPQQRRRRPR